MQQASTHRAGTLAWLAIVVSLTACGGGGGGSPAFAPAPAAPAPAPAPAPAAPAAPLKVKASSYENFKTVGLTPQTMPNGAAGVGVIRGVGDFSQSGRLDVFTAALTYSPTTQTPQTASPSVFAFWTRQADGSYVKDTTLLTSSAGCIHPRKAVVADFNGDGRPDVFVACHGFDAAPFPGERNKLVLSKPGGKYDIVEPAQDVGFFHGATAADLNGDGLPDVVVANSADAATIYAFINKGGGVFEREATARFPASLGFKQYYSVELIDVNEDGKLDLLVGGHEWSNGSSTALLLNPGSNDFKAVTPTILPAVANEGVVLDFTVTGSGADRALWLSRSSGGDNTFYLSRVVQKVTYPGLASSVVLNQRPAQWVPWLIPTTVAGKPVLASEDASLDVSVPIQ
ncbi:VCBS repeat-containing protein [Variovorax sp. J2P1-59]|uniref:FG-GAP repeat domain-containing protein n=1 Tax=Variovorax flavidus TaxID=3053501 RepID=UPI002578C18E|nr:VCBS repeat-containing protein [Variovorax sp. J2P1-59]MDM0075408.1 VCBS repeat-containing protein [Variovorax sp. J2P1-59]